MTNRLAKSLPCLVGVTVLVSTFFTSCEDDKIIEKIIDVPGDTVKVQAKRNDTDIAAFTIAGDGEDERLKASIRQDTIYVYWPAYWAMPATITPNITLAEKAAITPASVEAVPFETGTKYTVTAEDGTQKAYTLKKVVNQAQPYMQFTAYYKVDLASMLTVTGEYIIPDPALTALYLVSEAGGDDVPMPVQFVSATELQVTVPHDIDTGRYTLKLVSGWRTAYDENKTSLQLTYPAPALASPVLRTAKRGETYTLTGTGLRLISEMRAVAMADGQAYKLEIVAYTFTSITVKIPLDFPTGQYSAYHVDTPAAEGGTFTRNISASRRLTIEE